MKSKNIVIFFVCLLATIAIIDLTPINIDWGSVSMRPASTITVTGQAKQDQKNQIANFTVGVDAIEDTKAKATDGVNKKMNDLIKEIKKLNIPEEDLKTSRVSVYQETEYYEINGRHEAEKGEWRASNTLTIKLKNIDQSEELLSILNESEANSINGPNFSLDDTSSSEIDLLSEAIADAKRKAEKMAAANNQKVKKIITISEGGTYRPPVLYEAMPMSAGLSKEAVVADLEPGSTTLSKSVTVTFELR